MKKDFISVHIDPRGSKEGREYKKTKFVPELAILNSGGELVYTADTKKMMKSAEGLLGELQAGLEKAGSGKKEGKKEE